MQEKIAVDDSSQGSIGTRDELVRQAAITNHRVGGKDRLAAGKASASGRVERRDNWFRRYALRRSTGEQRGLEALV